MLRMKVEIRLPDKIRAFVPQPVKPAVGKVEMKDALDGNTARDRLIDTPAQQGGLAAPHEAGDHRDLARQTTNGDTPGQQPVWRLTVLIRADDSLQAFDHGMARCSLFALATDAIHAWPAGRSKSSAATAENSIRFRFREPNRLRKLCRERSRFAENGRGCYMGASAVYAASRS
jgi:hypothetical protein